MDISEVIMKLLIEQPLYGYVASMVSTVETNQIDTIFMAALPELVIYYNPVWFRQLSMNEKIGVLLHELIHVILLHPFRRNKRTNLIWSVACDIAVHELLPNKYILPDAVTLERMEKKLKITMKPNKNAEYYYELLSEVDDFVSFASIEGDSILLFEGKDSLKAQRLSEKEATVMELNALKSNLSQTISEAKSEGDIIPSALVDGIYEIYQDSRIDWRVILKRFLTGRGRMIVRKTYKRQSRRYEELPGTKRSVGVNALIAIDESGSISDSLVKKFYDELKEINKITGAQLLVTRFDTKCSEPVPLEAFVAESKRKKRGGTDFRPIFSLADEKRLPLIIIFTDGDGEAPVSVNQNTLWIITKNGKKPASFGYYLEFEG